jgi:hypothetical protein
MLKNNETEKLLDLRFILLHGLICLLISRAKTEDFHCPERTAKRIVAWEKYYLKQHTLSVARLLNLNLSQLEAERDALSLEILELVKEKAAYRIQHKDAPAAMTTLYSEHPRLERQLNERLARRDEFEKEIARETEEQPIVANSLTKEVAPEATPQTVENYIDARRAGGIHDHIIAFELYNKQGNFRLTNLEIARSLGLSKGLNETQFKALKQRAQRARMKGKRLLQEQKASA